MKIKGVFFLHLSFDYEEKLSEIGGQKVLKIQEVLIIVNTKFLLSETLFIW